MNLLRPIWDDLKARKLLPVAAVLLVAIVAVPVVLSGSSSTPAPLPSAGLPAQPATPGLPAVNETSSPSNAAPGGHARDPFAPASGAGVRAAGTTTSTTATTVAVAGSTSAAGSSAPASTGSSTTPPPGSSSTSISGSTPPSGGQPPKVPGHLPTPKPKPTIPTLTADESYAVSLALTNSSGGVDTIRPLERLSPVPSASQPLLVELGVLKGGSHVLFAVQPGTVVSGPGTCIPGPIECEILSLAQSQVERLSIHSAHGPVEMAVFAVTGISPVKHASRSAAMRIRNQVSVPGRRVLNHSSLNALSLFHYQPSVGAVVDLRNLTLRNS